MSTVEYTRTPASSAHSEQLFYNLSECKINWEKSKQLRQITIKLSGDMKQISSHISVLKVNDLSQLTLNQSTQGISGWLSTNKRIYRRINCIYSISFIFYHRILILILLNKSVNDHKTSRVIKRWSVINVSELIMESLYFNTAQLFFSFPFFFRIDLK